MVCLTWLLAVVMANVCTPGFGAMCWDSSICNDLSSKDRILDCIHLCTAVFQGDFPKPKPLSLNSQEDNFLVGILLSTLASGETIPEPTLRARSDMPRPYSMEHFRWGKPTARKRRPVKVFPSTEVEGTYSPSQARRQLGNTQDEVGDNVDVGSLQNQESQQEGFTLQRRDVLKPQQRKDGSYRMSHFRWGSPPPAKRHGSLRKPLEKAQGRLDKLLRNIMAKNAQ